MRNVKIGFWALATLLAAGCVVETPTPAGGVYTSCAPGDTCPDGSGCISTGCATSQQPTVDAPYQSCVPGDTCTNGTGCISTSLPSSSGYTGNLCSNPCNTSSDCLQDLNSFSAECVNGVCYLQCPPDGSCPYGTGCLTFSDQNGVPINLCTP